MRAIFIVIILLLLQFCAQSGFAGGWMTPADYAKCQKCEHPTRIWTTKKRCGENCIDVSNGCKRRLRRYNVIDCTPIKDCVSRMITRCKSSQHKAYWGNYNNKFQAWCVK